MRMQARACLAFERPLFHIPDIHQGLHGSFPSWAAATGPFCCHRSSSCLKAEQQQHAVVNGGAPSS